MTAGEPGRARRRDAHRGCRTRAGRRSRARRSGDLDHAPAGRGVLAARARSKRKVREAAVWGVPFAVKDNIDIAGLPTTAACPGYAYTPDTTAPAVQRLLDAGALLIGKTNLDQFATGLVGTRTPYGVPRNVFDAAYVPGGSSSGSACAVAAGIVPFALGTDTAGSGRVPAAFGNIVGLKPTLWQRFQRAAWCRRAVRSTPSRCSRARWMRRLPCSG